MGITKRGNDVRSLDLITKKLDKEVNYTEGSVNKGECNWDLSSWDI